MRRSRGDLPAGPPRKHHLVFIRATVVIASILCSLGCACNNGEQRARRELDAYKRARARLCSSLRGDLHLYAAFAALPVDDPRRVQRLEGMRYALLHVVPKAAPCADLPAEATDVLLEAAVTDLHAANSDGGTMTGLFLTPRENATDTICRAVLAAHEALDRAERLDWPLPDEFAAR